MVFAEQFYLGPFRHDVGCFWETATHELSIIDYLFRPGKIKNVKGMAVDLSGWKRDDFAAASVTFQSGLKAHIAVSWFSPLTVRQMTVSGEKGLALFDDRSSDKLKIVRCAYPLKEKKAQKASLNLKGADQILIPEIDAGEPLKNELNEFFSCIRSGKPPLTDIAHGLRVTEYLETISKTIK